MSRKEMKSPGKSHRFARRGFSFERVIRYFFASNAGLTVVILGLIICFLAKEGLGFFPGYQRELQIYRVAGLEFVDISRKNLTAHEQLGSVLNRAYYAEINGQAAHEFQRSQEASELYNFYTGNISATRDLILNNAALDEKSGAKVVMKSNYEQQKKIAVSKLPPTPHLAPQEREQLVASLVARPVEATEDPPVLLEIAAKYSAAQDKFAARLQPLRATIDAFSAAGNDLGALVSEMGESVLVTKAALQQADILEKNRKSLLAAAQNAKDPVEREKLTNEAEASLAVTVETDAPMEALLARRADCVKIHTALYESARVLLAQLPASLSQPAASRLLSAARKAEPTFLAELEKTPAVLEAWRNDKPVGMFRTVASFLTGKDWVTGGEWQDFYGILPLLVGSLMISFVALVIAIPVGIGAAIYTNQFALPWEQSIIKPVIEFIQAIPSVVLGFIGILVLGTILRDLSLREALAWLPGFPIEERLNIFTAGCLLALMGIPTIFSLAEDALNNVPTAYAEAAEALGASRVQNTFRVIVPAAFSGMLAAVLLGFGRVVGETMVVMLVAGNRIKIPDFTAGLGTFFQPAHTLTGIIAQELGEVPPGSVHYRALFVVGILLFTIILGINATAHRFFRKVKN